MGRKRCLLIVDVQNDFCTDGALAVSGADEIINPINRIMEHFDIIAASRDMHPEGTLHFDTWPVHCVQGSKGADFHPELDTASIACFLEKGTNHEDDGYSDFESTNIDFANFLSKQDVDALYVCGLATDYCVKQTVIDALRCGFKTFVLIDCIRAVDLKSGDGERALQEMEENGACLITTGEIGQ